MSASRSASPQLLDAVEPHREPDAGDRLLRTHQRQQPVDTGGVQTEAAPEFRFTARLYSGETTIALVPRPDGEAVASEQSSDQHA